MYRGTVQQYIYMPGQFGFCRVFFVISFFRLYVEGVFFVDGERGGLKTERRVGISGSFSCV